MGDSGGTQGLLGNMESNRREDEFQFQGTSRSILCSQTQERGRSLSVILLSKKVWSNNFLRNTRNGRENTGTLLENK
ncbi:hypothetical protein AYI68_g7335 [Smittium mucronatum]|uniref:Uncharacterized protein n=1 Tax=Smittium mucronatum TaxID=133383 RepID=A0A1R0GNY6_9FUNG|nr:hypothetical protein AYI68_g7335 [Smittium mucronatum]